MVDVVTRWKWFRRAWVRRGIFGAIIIVLALLSWFPRVYMGDVKLAPQDTNTAGLSSILSQLGGNYAALLGSHQPVEIDLTIGRSFDVQSEVARRLGMVTGTGNDAVMTAVKKLQRTTEVRALRAGVLEIEVNGRDPGEVVKAADIYARVMQRRLAELSRAQTAYKRGVLDDRMREATDRLSRAERAITTFRQRNRVVTPDAEMEEAVSQSASLRRQYQSAQVELERTRRFNSDGSFVVKQLEATLVALQRQIDTAQSKVRSQSGLTASGIAPRALEYEQLQRDLKFAQALYDSYLRYLEGTEIENLTADFNMQIIEPSFLDTGLHVNIVPAILLAIMALLAFAAEFIYLRRPVGIAPQSV
jgi:tyrosine-protein kinase Etk/Wzc